MPTTTKRCLTLGAMLMTCLLTQWGCVTSGVAEPELEALGQEQPWTTHEVPAISSVMRLTNTPPTDGTQSSELHVVAAKGEYEPASFVITPHVNVNQLQLVATDLQGEAGSIPASSVDLKVVKLWYQGGTAWYSYFGDSNRRVLVPELLLNDETLVKVDTENQENYLRIGQKYEWISYPKDKAEKYFDYLNEPVADAKTLQPIALKKDENKQIWVTVHVPSSAAQGVYTGKINMMAGGKNVGAMTLKVRVLPFELPQPRTYYNLSKPFLVLMYGSDTLNMSSILKVPQAEADRMQKLYYKDLISHNVINARSYLKLSSNKDRQGAIKALEHEIALMTEAGFVMKPLITGGWGYWDNFDTDNMAMYQQRIDDLASTLKKAVGHSDIYITSYDEAQPNRVKIMRPLLEYAHHQGLKVWLTTRPGHHFDMAGYLIDMANHGGGPNQEIADKWRSIGSKTASYAGPHTGPENPVVFRRSEGLMRYKANYDASYNFKYFSGHHTSLYAQQKANVWNDVQGGAFRKFNLVYPSKEGPIDTIAWEGFREGIDDIRYATLLKQEAAAANASSNIEAHFVAKKALIWLELMDDKNADLNAARIEMIDHILKIRKIMGK